jgi:hypothetical protein
VCPISIAGAAFPGLGARCSFPRQLLLYSIAAVCHFAWASRPSSGEDARDAKTTLAAVVGHWQSRHNRAIGETAACGCRGVPSHGACRSPTDRSRRHRITAAGRRTGAKPLSAAQPRLPSEARELLPWGGCRGGNAPAPALFSGLRGRGDAATLLKWRASAFWQGGVAALRRKKINADRMAFPPLPSTASQYDLRLRRRPRLRRGCRQEGPFSCALPPPAAAAEAGVSAIARRTSSRWRT